MIQGRRRERSVVSLANEQVSIVYACRLVGVDLDTDSAYGKSLKVHCPFGEIYHLDQGHQAAMRVYVDSNSAWCFACQAFFDPVRLVATAWDLDQTSAAVELLARAGIRPLSLAEAFAQAAHVEVAPDATLLAEALKTFCRRTLPNWADVQFEPSVASTLTRCLALLPNVRTDAEAKQWLTTCKRVMQITGTRVAVYK